MGKSAERGVGMEAIAFDPAEAGAALAQLPRAAAVFALHGADAQAEPYIGRTPNLRGRLERLLQPSARHPRRLQLAGRVRQIRWRLTGSEFESLLAQFSLLVDVFGPKALERMHLRAPAFVRYLGSNAYPRIAVTHRPSQREAEWAYGPFASRAAAERFTDEALKLFLLRRCVEDLEPEPSHPGCVYSEMKMCLAPCYQGCTDERYAEEARAVESFLATRGESRLVALKTEREEASARLEFETAAALHAQVQRVEAVRGLAPELVRPLSRLRAVILQAGARGGESAADSLVSRRGEPAALRPGAPGDSGGVAVFLYENGRLRGPAAFSTLGMRIQNEQAGSTSLFAQPVAVEAIPEDGAVEADASPAAVSRDALVERMEGVLAALLENEEAPTATERQAHLALVKRWYYRPEAKRAGEIFFPTPEGAWPVKALLRGVGRVAAKNLLGAGRQA